MVAMGTSRLQLDRGWSAFVGQHEAKADTEVEALAKAAEARIAELEAALRAIFLAADNAGNEREWADMVSAEMTDKRRALVSD